MSRDLPPPRRRRRPFEVTIEELQRRAGSASRRRGVARSHDDNDEDVGGVCTPELRALEAELLTQQHALIKSGLGPLRRSLPSRSEPRAPIRAGWVKERAEPRPGMRMKTIEWTPALCRVLAEAMAEGARDQSRAFDSPPSEGPQLLNRAPWPKDASKIESLLAGQAPVSYAELAACGVGQIPKREHRAFVPTAQGCGLRYNWKISHANSIDDLHQQAQDPDNLAAGWRISHLSCSGPEWIGADVEGFNLGGPVYDIVWTCDDDSNFLWGVNTFSEGELDEWEAFLKATNRRPICLVNSGGQFSPGLFSLVWIQDRKYLGNDDWKIITVAWNELEDRVDEERDAGYRPITATSWHNRTTLVMVSDGFEEAFSHVVWMQFSQAPFDGIADYRSEHPFMPMCVECKTDTYVSPGAPAWGDPPPPVIMQMWTIVGIESPDVSNNEVLYGPIEAWNGESSTIGPPFVDVADLAANKQRIHALLSVSEVNPLTDEKLTRTWWVRCRYFHPQFRAISCTAGANMDPDAWDIEGPGAFAPPTVVEYIDALSLQFMDQAGVEALTVAVLDPGGAWRLRRAYTLAPWEYEDTYPDTQVRIGSVAKTVTALTAWAAMGGDVGPTSLMFDFLPEDLVPVPGGAYPSTVYKVQLVHLIQQTAGWSGAAGWNLAESAQVVVDATAAAPVTMWGWKSVGDKGLLPLVTADAQRYQLVEDVFENNPKFDAEQLSTLAQVTGWRSDPGVPAYEPGTCANYSSLPPEMLGYVIEFMTPLGPSEPRADYTNYAAFARSALFQPLGMNATVRGRTARARAKRAEAIYPTDGPYAELTNPPLHTNRFYPTTLYSAPGEAAYDDDDVPPDVSRAPLYGTWTHGRLRVELFTPSGSWVSTAPDLCRLLTAFVKGEGSPVEGLIPILTTPSIPPSCPTGNPAGFNRAGMPVGGNTLGFTGWWGSLAWINLNLNSTRRVAVCTNYSSSNKFPYGAALLTLIKGA